MLYMFCTCVVHVAWREPLDARVTYCERIVQGIHAFVFCFVVDVFFDDALDNIFNGDDARHVRGD